MPVKSPKRRRCVISSRGEVSKTQYPGHVWSYDFILERTEDGKTLKFLTIVDKFSRVALSRPCGRSLTGLHVIRTLHTLLPVWGATDCLRSDNGSVRTNHRRESLCRFLPTQVLGCCKPCVNGTKPERKRLPRMFENGSRPVARLPSGTIGSAKLQRNTSSASVMRQSNQ